MKLICRCARAKAHGTYKVQAQKDGKHRPGSLFTLIPILFRFISVIQIDVDKITKSAAYVTTVTQALIVILQEITHLLPKMDMLAAGLYTNHEEVSFPRQE